MRGLLYFACTLLRAPVCLLGLLSVATNCKPVFRAYLAADSWLCDVGGIEDDGNIRRAPR